MYIPVPSKLAAVLERKSRWSITGPPDPDLRCMMVGVLKWRHWERDNGDMMMS